MYTEDYYPEDTTIQDEIEDMDEEYEPYADVPFDEECPLHSDEYDDARYEAENPELD